MAAYGKYAVIAEFSGGAGLGGTRRHHQVGLSGTQRH
jgi:hypothetical protein